jgi:hypothetical protein
LQAAKADSMVDGPSPTHLADDGSQLKPPLFGWSFIPSFAKICHYALQAVVGKIIGNAF